MNAVYQTLAEVLCFDAADLKPTQDLRADLFMNDTALSEIVVRLGEQLPGITKTVGSTWRTVADVESSVERCLGDAFMERS